MPVCVALLLDNAKLNVLDENGFTPLNGSCFTGNTDVKALLLDRDAKSTFGKTVILLTLENQETAALLCKHDTV